MDPWHIVVDLRVHSRPSLQPTGGVSKGHDSVDDPPVRLADLANLLHEGTTRVTLARIFTSPTASAHLTIAKNDPLGRKDLSTLILLHVGQAGLEFQVRAQFPLDLTPTSRPIQPADRRTAGQANRLYVGTEGDVTVQTQQGDIVAVSQRLHILLVNDRALHGNYLDGIGAALLAVTLAHAIRIAAQIVLA